MRSQWGWFLAWDGILPVAVAAIPHAIAILFPKNDIAEVSAVVLVPIVAALVRTAIGAQQIRNVCGGYLLRTRQIALALGIVLLLLFEGAVTLLTFADDEPLSAWAYPAVFYVC
jgi:hypothetical protein